MSNLTRASLSREQRWELAALLVWLLPATWLFFRPHEFVIGGADAGVYVNLGASIASTGGIHIADPTLAALNELTTRSVEHDAWLSDQDRDQVLLTRSQAESGAQIIQMAQHLDALERRLAQLELSRSKAESPE